MKNQNTLKLIVSVLIVFILLGVSVSALTLQISPSSMITSKIGDSQNFTITNSDTDGAFNLSTLPNQILITDSNTGNSATFTIKNLTSLNNINQATINVNLSSISGTFTANSFQKTLTINSTNVTNPILTSNSSIAINYVPSFCAFGHMNDTNNNLQLAVDITNNGQGTSNTWYPLDTINVRVRFYNNLPSINGVNTNLNNVVLRLGLYKQGTTQNVISNMIWLSQGNEQYQMGGVNSGSNYQHTFQFKIDPSQVTNGNYLLFAKAYPDGQENNFCVDYSSSFSSGFGSYQQFGVVNIIQQSDFNKMVVIDDSRLINPINAQCGQNVDLAANVYNVGNIDFQSPIKVILYNQELGLNLADVINTNLNRGDSTTAHFTFSVPQNATQKLYPLQMQTLYDNVNNNNVNNNNNNYLYNQINNNAADINANYRAVSTNTFYAYVNVSGNCYVIGQAQMTGTQILSGGAAGQPLVVKTTFTNSGNVDADYSFTADGYSSWANSAMIDQPTLHLNAGQSRDVTVTFNVNPNTQTGTNSFNLKVTSGNNLVLTQPFKVQTQSSGFSLGQNGYLIGLVALNVILVLVIIFVVVRVTRKK